jgi:hypothetical protein
VNLIDFDLDPVRTEIAASIRPNSNAALSRAAFNCLSMSIDPLGLGLYQDYKHFQGLNLGLKAGNSSKFCFEGFSHRVRMSRSIRYPTHEGRIDSQLTSDARINTSVKEMPLN